MPFESRNPFLSDPGVPGVLSMGPILCHYVTPRGFTDFADEDTKPILTDNAKRAIQGNVAMHVTCGAIWWYNL